MRDRSFNFLFPTPNLKTTSRWAPRIILLSLVVIIVSTLYPFKFVLSEPSSWLGRGTSRLDLFANVVLFIPLGFGLASALTHRKYSSLTKLLAILLVGGGLSLTIETLQTFLPGRDSTLSDVITNALGSGVGYGLFIVAGGLFYQWVPAWVGWLQSRLDKVKLKYLILAILGYSILVALLALSWQKVSLSSWELNQPLSLGSKVAVQIPDFLVSQWGQRATVAWNGTVSNLVISDRVLSDEEIERAVATQKASTVHPSMLALYPLEGNTALQDRTGQSPDLVWRGGQPTGSEKAGVTLSGEHWLTTVDPVSLINQRIRTSAQFTLNATISASTLNPSGFLAPPILAIGSLPETPVHPNELWRNSNFVLSQVGAELVMQMRISRTGLDRQAYTARIPAVFLDTKPHQVCIRYGGFALRVSLDGTERSFLFDTTPNRYQIVLYALVLMPLALLLSLLANRLQPHRLIYLTIVAGGSVLPALILERLLTSEANSPLRETNVLLGVLIMGGTILALKRNASPSAQRGE